jgi:hypothetical protein
MRRVFALVVCSLALLLPACIPYGATHEYEEVGLSLTAQGSGRLAVAVLDARPYINSNEKSPKFVGVQRDAIGLPFNVETRSGRPFADDCLLVITRALQSRGYDTTSVITSNRDAPDAVRQRLLSSGGRSLLVRVVDWKLDSYDSSKLYFDLDAQVLSAAGEVLGRSRVLGANEVKGNGLDPVGFAKLAGPTLFKAKAEELLNDPAIVSAMK